jgi:protein ImuA
MTDSPCKTPDPSSIRTVTLQRLAAQLEKMEKARKGRGRAAGLCRQDNPGSPSPAVELSEKTVSTGIEALDRLLPDAGFREGTLVEWLAESGSGDQLALLAAAPALGSDRVLIVIDGEKTFYPPAAAALGIDLRRLILVRPGKAAGSLPRESGGKTVGKITASRTQASRTSTLGTETLWALEQTLQSRGVAVTFCRLERLNARVFRRLQLAAERGGGLGFLIRAPSARNEPSWSDVRLWVEPAPAAAPTHAPANTAEEISPSGRRWRVEVLRCRRGAAGQRSILLEYNDATHTVHPAAEPAPAENDGQELRVETAPPFKRARRA